MITSAEGCTLAGCLKIGGHFNLVRHQEGVSAELSENKKKQMRDGLLYFVPVAISGLIPLITLPLFTRFLSPDDYGALALAQIWALLFSGVAQFGLYSAYDRNFFKYRTKQEESAKLLYSTVFFVAVASSVFICGTYLFRGDVALFLIGEEVYGQLVSIALVANVLSAMNAYYLKYFRNMGKAKDFVVYTVGISLATALAGIGLIVVYGVGVIGLVYAQLFSSALFFIVVNVLLMQRLPPRLDYHIVIEALKIGYPITFKALFGVLNQQFDKYMINLLNTLGGVGVYNIAQSISYIIFMFLNGIQNVFAPRIYGEMFDNRENGGEVLGKYLTPFAYLSVLPCLLLAGFAGEFVAILLPESFQGAASIIPVLTMYYGLMFFGKITPLQSMYAKKAGVLMWLLVFGIMLNVMLNIPFIMWWGAVGAAWATLIASSVSAAVSFFFAQRHYRIDWEYLKLAGIYLSFLLFVAVAMLIDSLESEIWLSVSIKCFGIGIYLLLGYRLGIVTRHNVMLLKQSITGR